MSYSYEPTACLWAHTVIPHTVIALDFSFICTFILHTLRGMHTQ